MRTIARVPAGVIATAAVLGLFGLTRGLQYARFPAFVDEALYAEWADRVAHEHDWGIALRSGKEPLLTWLAALPVWLGLDGLDAVKLVSLAAGLVTVAATALVARELGGRRAAVAAALLAAAAPFLVVHDVIGIMEPLLTAASTSALYLQIRLARRPTVATALGLGVALAVAFLTKRSGSIALALVPFGILALPSGISARGRARWFAHVAGAVAVGWGLGVESLRLSGAYDAYLAARDRLGSYHSLGTGLDGWRHWVGTNLPPYLSALLGYLSVSILVLVLVGLLVGLRRGARLTLLLAAWVVTPLAAAVLIAENPFPRYVETAVPPALALAGLGAVALWEHVARLAWKSAATTALAVAIAVPPLLDDGVILANPGRARYPGRDDRQFATDWPAGNAWVALAQELRRLHAVAAVCYGGCSFTVEWELRDRGFHLVSPDSQEAPTTPLVIVSDADLPPGLAARPLWRYERPRHGTPLVLYRRA